MFFWVYGVSLRMHTKKKKAKSMKIEIRVQYYYHYHQAFLILNSKHKIKWKYHKGDGKMEILKLLFTFQQIHNLFHYQEFVPVLQRNNYCYCQHYGSGSYLWSQVGMNQVRIIILTFLSALVSSVVPQVVMGTPVMRL